MTDIHIQLYIQFIVAVNVNAFDHRIYYHFLYFDRSAVIKAFYDRISNDMREAFDGLTEFCNRLDESERFDEPHLLPIALDLFGNEKLDVTSEYVAMRKTAKSKTMVTARRIFFDNYYSFVLTDFFEGLHYGHYPRRCPICKRYFLMTSARRQVYCNGTAPYTLKGKPITCRKYAARMKEKELSEGNPINPIM